MWDWRDKHFDFEKSTGLVYGHSHCCKNRVVLRHVAGSLASPATSLFPASREGDCCGNGQREKRKADGFAYDDPNNFARGATVLRVRAVSVGQAFFEKDKKYAHPLTPYRVEVLDVIASPAGVSLSGTIDLYETGVSVSVKDVIANDRPEIEYYGLLKLSRKDRKRMRIVYLWPAAYDLTPGTEYVVIVNNDLAISGGGHTVFEPVPSASSSRVRNVFSKKTFYIRLDRDSDGNPITKWITVPDD